MVEGRCVLGSRSFYEKIFAAAENGMLARASLACADRTADRGGAQTLQRYGGVSGFAHAISFVLARRRASARRYRRSVRRRIV
jgi:hypothetical protein